MRGGSTRSWLVAAITALVMLAVALFVLRRPRWSGLESSELGAAELERVDDLSPSLPDELERERLGPREASIEEATEEAEPDRARPTSLELTVRWSDDRSPLAGLGISAITPDARPARVRAETDARGRALLGLGSVEHVLLVTSLGHRRELDVIPGERNEFEWRLDGDACASGSVRDENGAPVPGATIQVSAPIELDAFGHAFDLWREPTSAASRRSRSLTHVAYEGGRTGNPPNGLLWLDSAPAAHADEAGEFRLRGDVSRRYVSAYASLRVPSEHRYVEGCGQEALAFTLASGGADVVGRVLRSDGRPAARCEVVFGHWLRGTWSHDAHRRLVVPPRPRIAIADGDGRFVLEGLPPGTTPYWIQLEGVGSCHGILELQPGVSHALSFELEPSASIVGTITSESGDPVVEARVEAYSPRNPLSSFVHVDERGRYEITGLPAGPMGLWIDGGLAGETHRVLELEAGAVTTFDVTLAGGLPLRLRIVDERGAPLVGYRVSRTRIQGRDELDAFGYATLPEARWTDADGRVVLRGGGEPVGIDVFHRPPSRPAFLAGRFEGVVPGEAWQELVAPDRLLLPGSVAVHAVDREGKSMAGCELRLRQIDGNVPFDLGQALPFKMYRTTDALGRATFEPVPAAELELYCAGSNWTATGSTSFVVHPGQSVDFGDLLSIADPPDEGR